MTKGATPKRYDAIVIGAGIAGLAAANTLVREGLKVLLLEQSHHAGGCMSGFWREGFYFDGGDQSFESGGVVFPTLREFGVYDLHEWEKVGYRVITPGGRDFEVTSLDVVEENYQKEFPGEPGIRAVFGEVRRFSRMFEELLDPWNVKALENPSLKNIMGALRWMPDMARWMHPDYKAKLCRAIRNPELRNWFTHYGYSQMPFILFAGFWYMWVNDYWYPSGGIQSCMDNLVKKIEERGGESRFKTPVQQILVEGKRVGGVRTESGEEIRADTVIYAGDFKRLVSQVLGKDHFDSRFVDKVQNGKVTESMVAVYLGLDMPPEELKETMKTHHVVRFPNYEVITPDRDSGVDVHEKCWVELSSPCFGGAGLAPEGKSSVVLQAFSTAEWQNYWHNGSLDTKRTPEYRELKKKVGLQLVKTAEAVIPGLGEKIVYQEVGSPLSLHRFTWNAEGASAGWCHDQSPGNVVGKTGFIQLRTPVEGLYAAGHWAFWPGGVPSAIASGKIAAGYALKRKPFSHLEKLMKWLGR